jgi:inner membrane protein
MDPLSQAALGAAASHALLHRQLGMRAVVIGAVVAMTPDLDSLYGAFHGPFARLESHRGITHSLFFGPVVGSIVGNLWWHRECRRAAPGQKVPSRLVWISLFVVALLSHPLLDWFTTYGTQLLSPFARTRFALHGIAIVDPLYTGILLVGILAAFCARHHPRAGQISALALVLTTAYLLAGLSINAQAETEARRQLLAEGIASVDVHAYPSMLQLPHRRIVAFTKDTVRVGYVSMWRPCKIEWGMAPRTANDLATRLLATPEGQIYQWFADGLLIAEWHEADGMQVVRWFDLRYGYGLDPLQSMWGMSGQFDQSGQLLGRPERFQNRPEVSLNSIGRLFADAFPGSCPKSAG